MRTGTCTASGARRNTAAQDKLCPAVGNLFFLLTAVWDRPGLPACTASGAFLILRTYTFHASADAYSCHTESRRFDLSSAVCLFRRQILRRAVPFVLACPDAVVSGRLVVFAILLLCTAPGSPSLFVLLCCDILPRAASPFLFYSIVIYCPGQPLPFCFTLL